MGEIIYLKKKTFSLDKGEYPDEYRGRRILLNIY